MRGEHNPVCRVVYLRSRFTFLELFQHSLWSTRRERMGGGGNSIIPSLQKLPPSRSLIGAAGPCLNSGMQRPCFKRPSQTSPSQSLLCDLKFNTSTCAWMRISTKLEPYYLFYTILKLARVG